MISEEQLAANRRNALKSTGPRTEKGKARSCLNAVTHGAYCQEVVLPYEDAEAYENLHERFRDAAKPADAIDEALVRQLAAGEWRLQRFQRMERNFYWFRFNFAYRAERRRTVGPDRFPSNTELEKIHMGEGRLKNECLKPDDRITPLVRAERSIQNTFFKALATLETRRELRERRAERMPQPQLDDTNPYSSQVTDHKQLTKPEALPERIPLSCENLPEAEVIAINDNHPVKSRAKRVKKPSETARIE